MEWGDGGGGGRLARGWWRALRRGLTHFGFGGVAWSEFFSFAFFCLVYWFALNLTVHLSCRFPFVQNKKETLQYLTTNLLVHPEQFQFSEQTSIDVLYYESVYRT